MQWKRNKKDEKATSLLQLIASNISAYESHKYLSKRFGVSPAVLC